MRAVPPIASQFHSALSRFAVVASLLNDRPFVLDGLSRAAAGARDRDNRFRCVTIQGKLSKTFRMKIFIYNYRKHHISFATNVYKVGRGGVSRERYHVVTVEDSSGSIRMTLLKLTFIALCGCVLTAGLLGVVLLGVLHLEPSSVIPKVNSNNA